MVYCLLCGCSVVFSFCFYYGYGALSFFRTTCVLLFVRNGEAVFFFFVTLGVGFFIPSFATDLTVFSFFLTSPGWTNVVFIFFLLAVRFFPYLLVFSLLFYLFLSLGWFFDPWYYLPTSLLFYQNTLLTNPLNLTHPVLVTGSIVCLFGACVGLIGLGCTPYSFIYYFYLFFLNSRRSLYYVVTAGTALLFGCFWALQLSTWGGWWIWENSELLLLFLFFLLVALLHSYFVVGSFFLVYLLAIFFLLHYILTWLFVFWWSPNSLHTFSTVSVFFFSHYVTTIGLFLLFIIFTTWRTRTVPYCFFRSFFVPTLMLCCWIGLWLSWVIFLGAGFLAAVAYIFMTLRVFKSRVVLFSHLLFFVFFLLAIFFNFSSYVGISIWLLIPCSEPLIYFIEAVATRFCLLSYLQTEPIYPGTLVYLPFIGLSFIPHNLYTVCAYLDPIFVFLCVSVICSYG
uniref:Cytochrome c-type biogenesis protein CcmF_i n=1 Tax=Euplotes cristatus TaxID=756077 RepID=UPI002E75B0B5|nr:Cytochrome c-type biogenesis protein CcmF_i [Euplotes cristatus]UPM52053.1 Cytochrome c-type biogenesis protein CcmF_i [Euplotes cristatus]